MVNRKSSKSKGKKIRFAIGREKGKNAIVEAIREMAEGAGMKWIPEEKSKKEKAKKG